MKKTLLAAGVALAVLGGAVTSTASAAVGVGISIGSPGYHHHHRRGHYWWHNRWYDYQPAGYVYSAPPYAYDHPYWRTHWRESHHRRDWHHHY